MWSRIFRTRHHPANYIVVVSGLPRSGTSMMMQMLEAGGMDVMTDHVRTADDNNPSGYYELEGVKRLKEDASFLNNAYGKAIKIVSPILYDIPRDKRCKIIFMRRHLKEILVSQKMMLLRSQKTPPPGQDDAHMEEVFKKHLRDVYLWLPKQENMDTLYVDYHEVINRPLACAQTVDLFLDNRLNVQKMVEAVDAKLYRERLSPEDSDG